MAKPLVSFVALLGLAAMLGLPLGTAHAARPLLDSGAQIDVNQPYGNAQKIGDVYTSRAIYGKLEGTTPIDIYTFTPDKDGSQKFSLLLPKNQPTAAQPVLIFVDSTTATTGQDLGLPLPSDSYHTALINQDSATPLVRQKVTQQQFHMLASQTVTLKKGTTYYLVVLDPYRVATRYAVVLGDTPWTTKDFFTSFGSLLRVESDNYAGTSPFKAPHTFYSFFIFLLGLIALGGIFIIQSIFVLGANRSQAMAFLLMRLQRFSRIIIWTALWFMAVGGTVYFIQTGWVGLPFVMTIVFIIAAIAFLYETFGLSRRLAAVATVEEGASIPLAIRKRWYFTGFIELVSLVILWVLLVQFIVK